MTTFRRDRVESTPAFLAGGAIVIAASGLELSALVGASDDFRASAPLALTGLIAALVGVALLYRYRPSPRETPATAFASVVLAWLVLAAISTVAYLAVGTFEQVDEAAFESVSGLSTTALSVLTDPEATPNAVLFWRALTQWIGGLLALWAVVAIFPILGVGNRQTGERYHARSRVVLRSRQTRRALTRLTSIYLTLTAMGIVLFAAAGMNLFDAVTYAATTISSGGFSNHAGSFAHFDSALIEWAGVGGMLLAGANLALLFRSLRGITSGSVLRSAELKAYLLAVVVLSIVVAFSTAENGLDSTELRHATFSVTSMVSTTGHTVTGWGAWDDGPQVLLMIAAGIGAMSGATGGGFRIARVIALSASIRREIVRQIHPRAVRAIKLGRNGIDDDVVDRMIGYQTVYLVTVGVGALVLAATGVDLVTAVSGAVSAVATAGPAMGDLAPGAGGASALPDATRLALLPLMVLGRLEFSPVIVGVMTLLSAGTRRLPRRRWA